MSAMGEGLRVEGEMVKVGRMREAKRILLIAGMLLVIGTGAEGRLWGSRKADKPSGTVAPSAIALQAVDVEGSRVLLRTSGAPAYTSYSPSPGVFVIDLTGTSRAEGLQTPANLPTGVASIAAEEVVEMGSRLTRVTFRLNTFTTPEVTAAQDAVILSLPTAAVAQNETPASPAPQPMPAVAAVQEPAVQEPAVEPVETATASAPAPAPIEEPIEEEPRVAEAAPAPVPAVAEKPLPRASTLRRIGTTSTASGVAVRITGDGQLQYKAFRLDNPPRVVVDLEGVRNAVKDNSVTVDDSIVQRVRAAQFQPGVARVVVDLSKKADYRIDRSGSDLVIAFGQSQAAPGGSLAAVPAAASPAMPAAAPMVSEPAPAPVRKAEAPKPQDVVAAVPAIAETAPAWKMPDANTQSTRTVINAAADQAPPASTQRPAPREDVFNEPAQGNPVAGVQTLSGARTLSGGPRVFTGEPISLNLKDADLKDVLRAFSEQTGLNIAVDPGVSGSVTVDFVDVPWDQALDLILRQNSLTFTIEGNVMRIGTIDRIAAETAATRRLAEEERLNVPLTTLSFKLSYARAAEVQSVLKEIASPRARIIVDPRTNQLIISEIPDFLRTMQNLITTIDVPTRQVIIEARIVESSRTFSQQWGVDWGFNGDLDPANGSGTGVVFPNRIGYEAGPFEFGAGNPILSLSLMDVLGTFNLDFALAAAEAQGFVKVVSAPRVTTQDNESANIQSGVQIPYQTRINFTTTISYLDATLSLQVRPQITEAGTVIMEIQVQKNEPAPGLAIAGAAGTPLTTRQAKTRLMVRDGGTAVIAGIFQTKENDSQSRVPFVHNIPVIGALFRTHDVSTSHDELLIFITPRIVRG
jgi:type IV pilus assembly protein PilQ